MDFIIVVIVFLCMVRATQIQIWYSNKNALEHICQIKHPEANRVLLHANLKGYPDKFNSYVFLDEIES